MISCFDIQSDLWIRSLLSIFALAFALIKCYFMWTDNPLWHNNKILVFNVMFTWLNEAFRMFCKENYKNFMFDRGTFNWHYEDRCTNVFIRNHGYRLSFIAETDKLRILSKRRVFAFKVCFAKMCLSFFTQFACSNFQFGSTMEKRIARWNDWHLSWNNLRAFIYWHFIAMKCDDRAEKKNIWKNNRIS